MTKPIDYFERSPKRSTKQRDELLRASDELLEALKAGGAIGERGKRFTDAFDSFLFHTGNEE